MSTLISGGTVVTAHASFSADVLIEDGRIAQVGADLRAETIVDARGKLVLPGAVDTHTHLEAPHNEIPIGDGDELTCDDYHDGTIAAAVGGTTTLVDFATQDRGAGLASTLREWQRRLSQVPLAIDVGLHMIVCDLGVANAEEELASLCDAGVTSYKLFMAYKESPLMIDDELLFRVAEIAARAGAVVLVHAESGDPINVLQKEAIAAGKTSAVFHARTRPPATEAEAVNRAIELCDLAGAPVYIMHVSSAAAVDVIRRARSRGAAVRAETCPQYLYVDESWLDRPAEEACKYVFTPPPRNAPDRAALWDALRDGVLDAVSTDHCPYTLEQKRRGVDSFMTIPNGAPGVENRLEVMWELGVRSGRLTPSAMVRLLSTAPAQLHGLHPRKGSLEPGTDADIVVFDPTRAKTISVDTQRSNADYCVYEGLEVAGSVDTVFFRGEPVVRHGAYIGELGRGRFLQRDRGSRAAW